MRFAAICLLSTLFLLTTGCGDDSDPSGPSAPVTDEITVSLDQITITRDCDAGTGGPGEFGYEFYVILKEGGEETTRYLDSGWSSFSANDGTSWDPGSDATFTLQRRADVNFEVRLRIRELDSVEEFSQGTFVSHRNDVGGVPWSPSPTSGVTEYTLYDSTQEIGLIDWDWRVRDDCLGSFQYRVKVARASE